MNKMKYLEGLKNNLKNIYKKTKKMKTFKKKNDNNN